LSTIKSKEKEMAEKTLSLAERSARGKKLLMYGMFSLVVVTFVAVFLTVYLLTAPVTGGAGVAFQVSLIVTAIALVASVVVWFVYTKAVLKE
jgi:uncharacterized membrane protein YdbT with pleckstrin-like domain